MKECLLLLPLQLFALPSARLITAQENRLGAALAGSLLDPVSNPILWAWLLSTPQLGSPPVTLASEFPLCLLGISL